MNYLQRARELKTELVNNRRQIHENPELGLDLPNTVTYVMDKLKEMGYEPKQIGGGVTAIAGESGKTILLRADMDALPMEEQSGLDFSSKNGAAHTCGHDMHAAMLLGAAKLLKENEANLKGRVKFMFQPAEEIFAGAKAMINEGIMEEPRPDCAMSSHVFSGHSYDKVFVKEGPLLSGCNGFKITIHGKGCHGAQPQNGIDPINIGVHIHLALQELISREVDFNNSALLTFGQFVSGTAANIIPETAILQGTLRTFNEEIREYLVERMKTIVKLTAEKFRGTADVEILSDLPVLMNDSDLTKSVRSYLQDMSGSEITVEPGFMATASEDFSFIAKMVPSVTVFFGASDMDVESYPMHHPKVQFDERVLYRGAAMYAEVADRWLKENS
ncbi:MAG: M20 family metallopeptidase [Suipraeoptans sp.]